MNGGVIYRSADGRDWLVTLDNPGKVLSVPPSLERSGALLPEHEIRIVFRSGDTSVSHEYTSLSPVEDLSEEKLTEWFTAAMKGTGL
jgi:hypothetical protein